MRKRNLFSVIPVVILLIAAGCAKRIAISYEQAKPEALVEIKTKSKKTGEGIIRAKKPSFLAMQFNKNSNKLTKIKRNNIYSITGQKKYAYDSQGKILSEWEIDKNKTNKNVYLYSLGGAGLSFGVSFFLGTLINRGMSDDVDKAETAMWATTAIGTTVGTLLFAKKGAKRDRTIAINQIREQRIKLAKERVEKEKLKQRKIQQELGKIKAERTKQNEEMELLKKKANYNKK